MGSRSNNIWMASRCGLKGYLAPSNGDISAGDKVYIPEEGHPYTVRAFDDRYVICTKPFNLRHAVKYFIIDLKDEIRGPDNQVFCFGYETDEQCLERLEELRNGETEISQRYCVRAVVGRYKT